MSKRTEEFKKVHIKQTPMNSLSLQIWIGNDILSDITHYQKQLDRIKGIKVTPRKHLPLIVSVDPRIDLKDLEAEIEQLAEMRND